MLPLTVLLTACTAPLMLKMPPPLPVCTALPPVETCAVLPLTVLPFKMTTCVVPECGFIEPLPMPPPTTAVLPLIVVSRKVNSLTALVANVVTPLYIPPPNPSIAVNPVAWLSCTAQLSSVITALISTSAKLLSPPPPTPPSTRLPATTLSISVIDASLVMAKLIAPPPAAPVEPEATLLLIVQASMFITPFKFLMPPPSLVTELPLIELYSINISATSLLIPPPSPSTPPTVLVLISQWLIVISVSVSV